MLNRWKGENVSTTEVSEVLGLLEFIQEANVYGVTIPGLSTQTFQIIVINIQNKISSHTYVNASISLKDAEREKKVIDSRSEL